MCIGSTVRARSGAFRLSARSVRGPEAGSLERVRRPSSLDASQRAAPRDVPSPAAGARLPTSAVGGVTFGRTSTSSRRHRPRAGRAHRGVLRCHEHRSPIAASSARSPFTSSTDSTRGSDAGGLPLRPLSIGRANPSLLMRSCRQRQPPRASSASTVSALIPCSACSSLRRQPRCFGQLPGSGGREVAPSMPTPAGPVRTWLRARVPPSGTTSVLSRVHLIRHVVGDGGTDLTRLTHGDEPVDRTGRRRLQRHRDGRSSGWLGRPSICGPALHAGQPRPKSEASIVPRRARPRRRGATDSDVLFHVKHRPATEVEEEPVSEARSIRPRCGGVAPGTRSTDDLT